MDSKKWLKIKELFSATIDLPENKRAEFLAIIEDDLRSEVEKLLLAYHNSEDFIDKSAFVELGLDKGNSKSALIGKKIDDYLILEEIGSGGMGAVFLAEQQSEKFTHRVALKLIKRGMDTDSVLKRFVMERQILANLEHPNIARFLDGGSTNDGLPFFVMEYIEGLPIKEFCEHHQYNYKERLSLFQKVCAAVSFAHQNLIVHRDLKPSNILVTKEGEPKLLDFGIAKLLHTNLSLQTDEVTATMFRVMTPEYASPEQLRGLPVTTASDVYSLGVVLYELLTGERPFKIKSRLPDEIAQEVLTQEPVKPSAIVSRRSSVSEKSTGGNRATSTTDAGNQKFTIQNSKSLRGDLDNIILKSLQKEPSRRYASVQEFADDIRRHLEGLPVTAMADTVTYRAAKFIKRHQAGVFAAASVVLLLLFATIITTWQARRANFERAKAEQRFNDVRRLANSVVFEFHDSIQNLPGSTPTRELLVRRALEYLDKLASESEQDRTLQLELAVTYDKIGDIQGGYSVSNLGHHQQAVESYSKALEIKEKLIAAEPDNVEFRRKLATGYKKLGDMRWVEADASGSLDYYRKSLEITLNLAAELPGNLEISLETALNYGSYGRMLGAVGRVDESLENLRKSVTIMEELTAANPNDIKFQRGLATAYDTLAEILFGLTKNYSEAFELYLKSQSISEKLLAANPRDTKLRRGQGIDYMNIARTSEKLGDKKNALENSRKSVVIFKELLSEDSQNEELRQVTAAFQTFYSEMLIQNGRASEAIEALSQSLQTFEKSYAASPNDEISHFRIAEAQAGLARGYFTLASDNSINTSKRLIHLNIARDFFQKSLAIYKSFQEAGMLTGEESDRIEIVTKGLAECDAAIARLQKK